jgi:hypothetical protein
VSRGGILESWQRKVSGLSCISAESWRRLQMKFLRSRISHQIKTVSSNCQCAKKRAYLSQRHRRNYYRRSRSIASNDSLPTYYLLRRIGVQARPMGALFAPEMRRYDSTHAICVWPRIRRRDNIGAGPTLHEVVCGIP